MCSQNSFVEEIQLQLKDITLHRSESKSVSIQAPDGYIIECAVIMSSSGKVYHLGDKVDDVQKGTGQIRKVYQVRENRIDYENPLAAKIYPLAFLRQRMKKGDDFIQEICLHNYVFKRATENLVEGVVPVHECIVTDDKLLMIMAYYNGKDLFYYLSQSHSLIAVEVVKSIFQRLLTVVSLMHDNGVIHRDISCENIYYHFKEGNSCLDTCKRPKHELDLIFDLGDFGMSTPLTETHLLNQTLGKPSYKCPELVASKMKSQGDWMSNDVWALGIVLYMLLMRSFPFGQASCSDITFHDRIVKENLVNRAIQELSRSCYRAYDKDYEERIKGLQLVQRILRLRASDRISISELLGDSWLQDSRRSGSSEMFVSPVSCIAKLSDPVDCNLSAGGDSTTVTPSTSEPSNSTHEAA